MGSVVLRSLKGFDQASRSRDSPGMPPEKLEIQDTQESEDEYLPQPASGDARHDSVFNKLTGAIIGACRLLLAALVAPGYYILSLFWDTSRSSFRSPFARRQKPVSMQERLDLTARAIQEDVNVDSDPDSPARNTRSQSSTVELPSLQKRSIKIKTVNSDELKKRRRRSDIPDLSNIKSPTSPGLAMTRYPRAPVPPRPLVPRRQPSYSTLQSTPPQKTLIIDLDETLIHSMAKGGRMSTGHMVEVRLSSAVGVNGGVIAPQVPILYYVHKRPHCDEFLRKVSKWYNLIVFTASVQEYADPVIDWLELERKYFSARYYRQHCTYRNGAYIKDLSQVEPDLSRVLILDNSPISYIFHEDNALPIEGWISDPTDNDLLHLIPLLEGLQHTTDVRALLALRLGESSV